MATKAAFARMNGLGNQIIVADMRGRADSITSAAAIRLASDSETAFDQIMAIHDPRTPGTDYYIAIINCDGTQAQACGNGTRCVVQALAAETGRHAFTFETRAGILTATEHDDGLISVDMGTPRFDWQDIPLAQAVADTRKIELQVGPADAPVLHSPSIASMGNPMRSSGWIRMSGPMSWTSSGRFSKTIRSSPNAPIFPSPMSLHPTR